MELMMQPTPETCGQLMGIPDPLKNADLSKYKDSMRPLMERDIAETEKSLTMEFLFAAQ